MKVSDYIAARLAAAGISKAFLVQGAANNDLIYSIADRANTSQNDPFAGQGAGKVIDYVCPMHEQAAGFMAEGWSKVTGLPGLTIGTSGPGGQNLLTPICNFFYDSVPGIFITGQVNSQFMRQHPELRQVGFQEWPAHECFRSVTKHSTVLRSPSLVAFELDYALWVCQEGRPGPVHIDIPIDVQRAEINPDKLQRWERPAPFYSSGVEKQAAEFVEDFRHAQRPVVIIGGGVRSVQALQWLGPLSEMLRVPIFPTWNALDVVTSDHQWYGGRFGTYGGPGRNFAVQNADLILAIGCRLSGRLTGGNIKSFARAAKRYVVDVDSALLRPDLQQLPFHVNIKSDAGHFMSLLETALRRSSSEDPRPMTQHEAWVSRVREWRELYDPVQPWMFQNSLCAGGSTPAQGIHPYAFARALSNELPSNAIIVYDCGGNAVAMNHAFKTKMGQRYFSNNGNSPMGFAFAAALGAWFAAPERPVVCVIGDGGFMMNIQEIQTLVNYGANVKTFVLDNRIYGITKQFQDTHFSGRFEASGPKGYNPPAFFDKVVRSFGDAIGKRCDAWRIYGGDLHGHINEALGKKGPVVCVVECPEFRTYEPRIAGWATPIEDMTPLLPREEFRANMIIDPLQGWESGNYGPYHGKT